MLILLFFQIISFSVTNGLGFYELRQPDHKKHKLDCILFLFFDTHSVYTKILDQAAGKLGLIKLQFFHPILIVILISFIFKDTLEGALNFYFSFTLFFILY